LFIFWTAKQKMGIPKDTPHSIWLDTNGFDDKLTSRQRYLPTPLLGSFDWISSVSAMPKKFVQVLVVALATIALMAFVYPDDDLSDNDFARPMLQESPVKIPTHRNRQVLAVDSPPPPFVSGENMWSARSSKKSAPATLLSLAVCVLRCWDLANAQIGKYDSRKD
jgi:hypothetical protein